MLTVGVSISQNSSFGFTGLATSLLTNDILLGITTQGDELLGERTRDVLQGGLFNVTSSTLTTIPNSTVSTFFDVLPDVEVCDGSSTKATVQMVLSCASLFVFLGSRLQYTKMKTER